MTFIWPSMLWSLVAVPLVIGLYLLLQRRRRSLVADFGGPRSRAIRAQGPGFRRHVPAVLYLLSLVILLVALARPQAEMNLPSVEGTVMLVFDVSASMGADDVEPTRMEAAQAAARAFVLGRPDTVRIGIISFSGSGFAVQMPTNDADDLLGAISRLEPGGGTSLGQGILAALNAIAVEGGLMPATEADSEDTASAQGEEQDLSPEEELLAQLPEGSYPASVIVLLSDGEDDGSFDPLEAVQAAAERDVRIDALGFGTTAGATLDVDGFSVHTALDEAMLQKITEAAGGTTYDTLNEPDAQAVYAKLTPELTIKPEYLEITAIFAGAGILVLILGAAFSLLWFNRLP